MSELGILIILKRLLAATTYAVTVLLMGTGVVMVLRCMVDNPEVGSSGHSRSAYSSAPSDSNEYANSVKYLFTQGKRKGSFAIKRSLFSRDLPLE